MITVSTDKDTGKQRKRGAMTANNQPELKYSETALMAYSKQDCNLASPTTSRKWILTVNINTSSTLQT